MNVWLPLDVIDDPVEKFTEFLHPRQAEIDERHVLAELLGDPRNGSADDDRLVGVAEMVGDVAQATDDSQIGPVVLGEVVEVLEEIDRRFELGHHGVEGGDRIAGAAGSPLGAVRFAAALHDPLRDRPDEQILPPPLGDLAQATLDPFLLPGGDVDDRVAGADEDVDLARGAGGDRLRCGLGGRPRVGRGAVRWRCHAGMLHRHQEGWLSGVRVAGAEEGE